MMKALSSLTGVALLTVVHLACNPDCESLQGIQLSTNVNPSGYEILIKANPISSLKNRRVSFGNVRADSTRYIEGIGLIVKIPAGISGDMKLEIEDPDCLDVLSYDFRVVDKGYFENNIDYVPPTPPEIIIPTININPPQFIDNAWLCPENPGYCLWFQMAVDSMTGEKTKYINPSNSFEQATCGCLRTSNLPYAQNRMWGYVDKDSNQIQIFIDRRQISGGFIEEFKGRFIDMNLTKYRVGWDTVPYCPPCPFPAASGPLGYMMLLTSVNTGRQVVVYQKNP